MSSLLDVLHKRPPRAHAMAPEPAQLAAIDSPPVELNLAPEPESAAAVAAAAHLHGAESALEATREMHRHVPAGDTTAFKRWSDQSSVVEPQPEVSPAPALRAPETRRRLLPAALLAVLVLVVVAAGFAAWQTTRVPEDSFLAPPGELPQPAEPVAAVEEEPPAVPVAPPRTSRRKAVVTDQVPAEEAAPAPDAPAWYDQPALPAAPAEAAPAPVIQVTRGSAANPLFEKLRGAYDALRAGDAASAESLYREVLAADPGSVDALLGLATLAARGGRTEEARDLYRRVQGLDPKNSTAMAALSALPGAGSATGSESQLKSMLRDQPAAAALHFALGLRYLSAQRWPDAQMAFFEAVRHDPRNPDYAFNLAVSLDRLGQTQPAASYYQRAIDLATGGQQFDVAAARARLATLQSGQG